MPKRRKVELRAPKPTAVIDPGLPPASQQQPVDDQAPTADSGTGVNSRYSLIAIRDQLIPILLRLATGVRDEFDAEAFKRYRDALVREGGGHNDVLEQLLLEQVAMAHLASFQLQAKAGLAGGPEAAAVYAAVAVKLMGEVRRTVVAIKSMRSPPSPANITVTANQQVHLTKAELPSEPSVEKNGQQSELGGNREPGQNRLREILGEGAGRSSQRETAGAID